VSRFCSGCGAAIVWGRFARSGKAIPLDEHAPRAACNLRVIGFDRSRSPLLVLVPRDELAHVQSTPADLRRAHFASCPLADELSRPPSNESAKPEAAP
jgi:hypothetical protein